MLAKLRIETIDLKTVYRDLGYDPEGLKMSPDDVVHPNAEGHRLAAAEILKRLAEPLSRAAPRPLQRGADRHGSGRAIGRSRARAGVYGMNFHYMPELNWFRRAGWL